MANIFLAIPQYKKIPAAEIERIRNELKMEGWKPYLEGFHPMFDQSFQNLINISGHKIRYCIVDGDGNLPRARTNQFGVWRHEYETQDRCDYFMILDDDISWDPQAIDILIEDDKPIVGGIYTFKTDNPNYLGKACTRFFDRQEVYSDKPFQVRWLNGGFILVKAETLLTMINAYPELVVDFPSENNPLGIKETWALWLPAIHERKFLGEDWAFCQRAREIGFDIWADLRIKLIHWNAENGYAIHV